MMIKLIINVVVNHSARCCASRSCQPARGLDRDNGANPTAMVVSNVNLKVLSATVPMLTIMINVVTSFLFTSNFSFSGINVKLCNVKVTTMNVLSALKVALTASTCKPVTSGTNKGTRVSNLNRRMHGHASTLSSLNGAATTANGKFTVNSTTLAKLTLLTSCVRRVHVKLAHLKAVRLAVPGNSIVTATGTAFISFVGCCSIALVGPGMLSNVFVNSVVTFLFYKLAVGTINHTTKRVISRMHHRFHRVGNVLAKRTRPSCRHYITVSAGNTRHRVIVPSLVTVVTPVLAKIVFKIAKIINLLVNNLDDNFMLTVFVTGTNNT